MHADAPHPAASDPAAACRAAEAYLERCIGLDAQTVGSAAVARAVRLRMEACGVTDERAFLARLAGDAEEHRRFIDEVVVPESWFFRDPQIFESLREFAGGYAIGGQAPLRILCAPCAAGEEPFSVAMALFEAGFSAHQFRIDATDVSHAALERAALATYSPNAFRGADLAFRDRWFRQQGTAFALDDAVRRQVDFFWGNLLDDSFADGRQPYDVVFCRNLLIYLTADARDRVARTIERLLAPEGMLVLGAAEPPILRGGWLPGSNRSAFALRRGTLSTAAIPDSPRLPPWPFTAASPFPDDPASAPAVDRPPAADDLLREAHALADAGRHAEALEICRRHQEAAGPSAQVFFLMGLLHQTAGDLDRAEACLHKTLYMDPDRDDAFLSLAVVAARRGDDRMAARYRQSAVRVLSRKGGS